MTNVAVPQPHGGALRPVQPGQVLNPTGRPKGSVSPAEAYRSLSAMTPKQWAEVARAKSGKVNGIMRICAKMLLVADRDPAAVIAGDRDKLDRGVLQFLSDFTDRLDGKAVQHTIHEVHTVPPPAVLAKQLAEHVAGLDDAERQFLADLIRDPSQFLATEQAQALPPAPSTDAAE